MKTMTSGTGSEIVTTVQESKEHKLKLDWVLPDTRNRTCKFTVDVLPMSSEHIWIESRKCLTKLLLPCYFQLLKIRDIQPPMQVSTHKAGLSDVRDTHAITAALNKQ